MISRMYAVHDDDTILGYKGFNRDFFKPSAAKFIGLIKVDGTVEAWAFDDNVHAKVEFMRFLKEESAYAEAVFLGIYEKKED